MNFFHVFEKLKHKDVVNTAKEEGREEGIYETAKNGIIAGLSNEVIKLMTKLTDEQINEIRNSLNNNE